MPPPSTIPRKRLHMRSIRYEGWFREDGLLDIEARLVDRKDDDFDLLSGLRPAGEPVHEMWARVTIDTDYNVHAVAASSDRVPYSGCERVTPDYARLNGTNLLKGFRPRLHEMLGGIRGCSHLTDLFAGMPTAAIQTLAGVHGEVRFEDQKPFQLDRCHALASSSDVVRRYYPKWYKGAA
jgi:DUF2889 family protein